MKTKTLVAVLLLVQAAARLAAAAGEDDASRLYYAGLYQEIGLGDIDQAVEIYRRASEGGRGEAAGRSALRMGLCYEKMGKPLEARDAFNRAIAHFSSYPGIVETASEGLIRLYADGAPEEDLRAGLISRGLAAAARGELEEAKGIFKQAYGLEPENPSLQKQLADLSKRLGQTGEAIYYYQRAAQSPEYSSDLSIHCDLAECYRQEGRPEEAVRLWGSFLEAGRGFPPGRDRALFELDLIYERTDAPAGAEAPAGLSAFLSRGEEQTRSADYRSASETYRAARERFGGSHLPPARLASLYERFLDQPTVAVWYYKEALSKAPPLAAQRLRSRLARVLVIGAAPQEAARYLDQYLSRDARPLEADPVLREFLAGRAEWKGKK